MTTPHTRRRIPLPVLIVFITIGILITAGLGTVGLVAMGIIGYGAAAPATTDQARDAELTRRDPAGAYACDDLDAWLAGGLGSFETARDNASTARTPAIRDATTEASMYEACVAAGSNMSAR